MSNIIGCNEATPKNERIVMSNQGTDCFLDLLICAADAFEQTESQKKLISFLKDKKDLNGLAPGTAGFDLDELPWQKESMKDDRIFLLSMASEAQNESTFKKLPYAVNGEIVIPWLKQFAVLVRQLTACRVTSEATAKTLSHINERDT